MVSSGEDAFERLTSKAFDLVITDLNMYETDGIAVLKKVKSKKRETVVILHTGNGHITSSYALSLGFDGFITKPISLVELLKLMKTP